MAFPKKKEAGKRRVHTTLLDASDCHVELLKHASALYNVANYYIKTIHLYNQEVYFGSLPADKQVEIEKYRTLKFASRDITGPQIWHPRYASEKDEDGNILALGLDAILQGCEDYGKVNSVVAQGVLQQVDRDWKSFEKGIVSYWKDKSKFKGIPRPPHYKKDGPSAYAVFPSPSLKLEPIPNTKSVLIRFPEKANLAPIKVKLWDGQLQQVRLRMGGDQLACDCIYFHPKLNERKPEKQHKRYLLIDLGIDNLMTLTDDAACLEKATAWIIDGLKLKSINQGYNRTLSLLKSRLTQGQTPTDGKPKSSKRIKALHRRRNRWVKDLLHCASKMVVEYAREHGIDAVIVGYNEGWKQDVNLGAKTNQKFVQIPFRRLIDMLKYKLEDAGIEMVTSEEGYTSKTDHAAREPMKHIAPAKRLGRRLCRGLFQSSTGVLSNADVNGGIGIGRKRNGDAWNERFWLANSGVSPTPVRHTLWPRPKAAGSMGPDQSRRRTSISPSNPTTTHCPLLKGVR